MKPSIFRMPTADEIAAIEETKNSLKVVGKVRQEFSGQSAVTIFFLADGSEIIEDDGGNVLNDWPEYVPPAPEEGDDE